VDGHLAPDAAGARRHDDDAVGDDERLLDVVRDEQDRARLALERASEPRLHLRARDRVERAERLVEAEHRLARQQRAQERDALAHPAAQLVGVRALEAAEPELLHERQRLAARLVARAPGEPQRQRRVVERRQPRQQRVALRHEHRGRRHDRPGRRLVQPAHEVEQRRLAAAARPHDRDDLAWRDLEREVLERDDVAEAAHHAIDANRGGRRRRRRARVIRWCCRHRSLRGHYPTGSKGRRLVRGALSAGRSRQPPWCAGASLRRRGVRPP
jgi:hypothetical protein